MRALSAAELLDAWERGLDQSPARRALTLLAAACPETSPDALARLSVGRRDAGLLSLRERTFGPSLIGLAACPGCGERLELAIEVADVRVAAQGEPAEEFSLGVGRYEVRFRLPNSLDLAAVAGDRDVGATRRRLFGRCLLASRRDGEATPADRLPARVVDAVVERMAQADPQADIGLALDCPACGHGWRAAFDPEAFLWREVDAWAHRLLRDVHALATAYGWGEAEILAMSPRRRQLYLEMIGP